MALMASHRTKGNACRQIPNRHTAHLVWQISLFPIKSSAAPTMGPGPMDNLAIRLTIPSTLNRYLTSRHRINSSNKCLSKLISKPPSSRNSLETWARRQSQWIKIDLQI